PEQVIWSILGWALVGAGAAILISSWIKFRKAKTDIRPDKPSSAIIRDGLYHFSRNPIYLCFLIFQAGIGLLMNNLWVMLLLPVTYILLTRFVIAREEAYLERAFGEDYRSFRRTVRRWL
ncbi:MAG: isoprenylcysteine carboxylmethyltransferase family protein, partial [Rhodospirillales bacterium]|nr:isoprenylcysteine carboxylmethyltransferase family protein [Rhodospirillales bacterium]